MLNGYVLHLEHTATIKMCQAGTSLRSSFIQYWNRADFRGKAKKKQAADMTKWLYILFIYFAAVDTPTLFPRNSNLTSTKDLA